MRVALSVDAAEAELAVAAWELAGVHNSSVEYVLGEPTEEPWPGHDSRPLHDGRAEVAAYLSAEQWSEIEASARTSAAVLLGGERLFHVKQLPNRDWRTAWHDHFDLVRIPGPRPIVIRPPHIPYEAKPSEVVIDLVPGLAFGTGQHQSTRLCLGFLAEQIRGGERVLDVGTGSGILAVAAAKLGAGSVVAVDIDPLAVDAARQTVRQNRLSERVEVQEGSIPKGERFDVVVANLTADLLQHLASDLRGSVKPTGILVVSGLIRARLDETVTSLRSVGFVPKRELSEDHWSACLLD